MTITAPSEIRPTPSPARVPDGHERVVIRHDERSGMRLIVAVHSTALGPALGGLRLRAYPGGLPEALEDVLGLARTMTLKASAAGLDLGGGKAVMIDRGDGTLRRHRFEAAARVIDSLGGGYITAEDIGTTCADMDVIAEGTRYVTGRSLERGGAGDPSPTTAATVRRAIGRALESVDGSAELGGRRVGVIGLGKVGGALAAQLVEAGARVVAVDVDAVRLERLATELGLEPAGSTEDLLRRRLDVLAPCAMGGAIDRSVAAALDCDVVCGSANNPLAGPEVADRLATRGILCVPDFLANCGGLIHVDAEWRGFDPRRVEAGMDRAMDRLEEALCAACDGNETPVEVAERHALERVARARAGALANV